MIKSILILFSILALSSCKANKTEQLNSTNVKVEIEDVAIYGCENGFCNNLGLKFNVTNNASQTVCLDNDYSTYGVMNYLQFLNYDNLDIQYNLRKHPTDSWVSIHPDYIDEYMQIVREYSPIILKENSTVNFYQNVQIVFKNDTKLKEEDLKFYVRLHSIAFDCDISKKNYVRQTIESKVKFY